jgi:hypothetical protein
VCQFYRLLFLSLEMGITPIPVQRHSNYGERCRKNYDANAKQKKTQGKLEK